MKFDHTYKIGDHTYKIGDRITFKTKLIDFMSSIKHKVMAFNTRRKAIQAVERYSLREVIEIRTNNLWLIADREHWLNQLKLMKSNH